MDWKTYWKRCREPEVVRRSLKYAFGVGIALIAINHGDAIWHGHVTLVRVVKMILTVCVPYLVSTSSSVAAMSKASRPCRDD